MSVTVVIVAGMTEDLLSVTVVIVAGTTEDLLSVTVVIVAGTTEDLLSVTVVIVIAGIVIELVAAGGEINKAPFDEGLLSVPADPDDPGSGTNTPPGLEGLPVPVPPRAL